MRWQLLDGGELELLLDFIAKSEQLALFEALSRDVPWQQREIKLFGRALLEPRETAWIGDPHAVYTYSGRLNEPAPWPHKLADVRARVVEHTRSELNCVLCNRYRDGHDSMGFHADAEPELGLNPVIASLSLGATRRFQLRHRKARPGDRANHGDQLAKLDLDLPSGSLLIMRGTTQQHYRHGVPKQPSILSPRINLTFRRIIASPNA